MMFVTMLLLFCLPSCRSYNRVKAYLITRAMLIFQDSKIKFPLPHRVVKSQFKSKFVAKRPNTCY